MTHKHSVKICLDLPFLSRSRFGNESVEYIGLTTRTRRPDSDEERPLRVRDYGRSEHIIMNNSRICQLETITLEAVQNETSQAEQKQPTAGGQRQVARRGAGGREVEAVAMARTRAHPARDSE